MWDVTGVLLEEEHVSLVVRVDLGERLRKEGH